MKRSTRQSAAWVSGLLVVFMGLAVNVTRAEEYGTFRAAYDAGQRFIAGGELAKSQPALEEALKLAPNDEERLKTYRMLLVPYRELPETAKMQEAADYIIAHSDRAAEKSLTRRAFLAFAHRRGKLDAVIDGYEVRLKKDPNDRVALFVLGEAYDNLKPKPERSAELLKRLASLEGQEGKPQDVRESAKLAAQLAKSGKSKDAAELYEKIAPLDHKLEAWHWKEAAVAWKKAGNNAKALEAAQLSAQHAEERNEQLAHFWNRQLGELFIDLDEPALAIPHLERAIEQTQIEGYQKACREKLELARTQAAKKKP